MKIAVSGKGGVGKTTLCALLCRGLEAKGRQVIAIDADSNPNLAYALGLSNPDRILPLADMEDLIREKTGADKNRYGAYFKMNPEVSDIPARFKHVSGKVQLLVMGSVRSGGGGCACPEYVLIKNLIGYLLLNADQDLVIDMEAGLEHLGRGVTEKVDALLIVVQPERISCLTAGRIFGLAQELKIKNVFGIGNQMRRQEDQAYLKRATSGFEFLTFFPFYPSLQKVEREGQQVFAISKFRELTQQLIDQIERITNG